MGVDDIIAACGVVDRNSGGSIIRIYNTYAPLIARLRIDQGRPTMYVELQILAAALSARRGIPVPAVTPLMSHSTNSHQQVS